MAPPRLTYEKDIRGTPLRGYALDSDEVLTRIVDVLDCSAMIKLLTAKCCCIPHTTKLAINEDLLAR